MQSHVGVDFGLVLYGEFNAHHSEVHQVACVRLRSFVFIHMMRYFTQFSLCAFFSLDYLFIGFVCIYTKKFSIKVSHLSGKYIIAAKYYTNVCVCITLT